MTKLEGAIFPYEKQTLSYMGYDMGYKSNGSISIDSVNYEEYILLFASYNIVKNKWTIREAAMNVGFAKSTLHYKIHKELRFLCPGLYLEVCHQMNENMKRFGGNHKG